MPTICRYVPNRTRPRPFKARDAGRIICLAIENGATRQEIFAAAEDCLGKQCDCERIEQFLNTLLELLAGALIGLALPEAYLVRLGLPLLRAIAKVLPGSKVGDVVRAIEALGDSKAVLGEIKQKAETFLLSLSK